LEEFPHSSPLPPALRWAGPFLAAGFAAGAGLREAAYALGFKKARAAPLPVLSIGNLSAGGTGKTPAVAYVIKKLLKRERQPAVLARGYGAQDGARNDEALELERALPGVKMFLNPNRYDSALRAKEAGCDLAVLDDGFQHWQLKRELDIVLLDATAPLSNGRRLPWGFLREHPSALSRAHLIWITRSDLAGPERCARLKQELAQYAPRALVALAVHAPVRLRRLYSEDRQPLEWLSGKRVFAACGLGNPEAFFETLRRLGADVPAWREYPDHHSYDAEDRLLALNGAAAVDADALLISEKDAVKWEALPPLERPLPIYVLGIEFKLVEGETESWQAIAKV
jgi:tetraacyldisaccharide 4'-kinase